MKASALPSRPHGRILVPEDGEAPAEFARRMWHARSVRQPLEALGPLTARRCATLVADAFGCWDEAVEAALRRHSYAKVMSDAPGIARTVTAYVQGASEAPGWLSESMRAAVDDCLPYGWSVHRLSQGPAEGAAYHIVAEAIDVAPYQPVADSATARAAALAAVRGRRSQGRARLLRYLRSTGRFEIAEAVAREAVIRW